MKLIYTKIDNAGVVEEKNAAVLDFLKRKFNMDAFINLNSQIVDKGTGQPIKNISIYPAEDPNHKKPLNVIVNEFMDHIEIDYDKYTTKEEYDVLKICLSAHGYTYFICVDKEGRVKTFNDTDENIRVFREANDNKNIE